MAFRIDSDNRWKSYGGLAGVFVFCSIAITGTLWHSRPHRLVRGEDAAAVAAAAYERRWALWASGDPASLPPRFGPSAATAALRRARIDFSGLASGSPAPPLEWDGDPRSWQPKYFKIRPPARDYTDEGHRITWWFGGTGGWESAASSCTVVGSDRSNELHNAFSDTGGVFRAHGFEVSPPFFEGTVNPWECGIIPGHSGGWPRRSDEHTSDLQ